MLPVRARRKHPSTRGVPAGMVPRMKAPNLEDRHTGDAPRDSQAGAPHTGAPHAGMSSNAFGGGAYVRHAQLGTWWERVLAVLSLIFVTATVISLVIRSL
jgi:hypothetical protein